ncbi:UDP-glucose/GDP-mannose dehydrogenase family protein [Gottfriedia acidiceleris]|uniref:UDP-glucose dehydrogenase family protein n=1 Tax=Bacillaceae TaxID=186817 RepID=UPI000BED8BCF|nr:MULTISPECIES: UDP-glucose/GDP-mannose dehydrogenase family protein [unclassified Bacillus (in: firmicutes)]PEC49560.1 UDP-glucose 6-dehydrogenase [Bacillus sp. AFS096315]PFM81700.1 UDP-glucose 6-dehydrogenase [Bacillus sp. AFS077874]
MITVIGLGFVGLTTALGFSEKGYHVYGFDIDQKKKEQLRNGKIPFYEPNLNEKLNKHFNKGFTITDDLQEAVINSEVIFLCVGTPSKKDGSADLGYIFEAIKNVTGYIKKPEFKVLVIKSTIPPSTTSEKIKPYLENLGFKVGVEIGLTNNPEFLREGYAWDDFMNPDRIVVGQEDDKSGRILETIYQIFNAPIYQVSLNTAEFIKYLSNTMLATLISFANEQSLIARSIGNIDIKRAFQVLHLDRRWSGAPANMSSYVFPGCGFGGYCLPKDTMALVSQSLKNSYTPELLTSTLKVNEAIKEFVVIDIERKVEKNENIGILGLAFKPNSNDIRDTPAKAIIQGLLQKGYTNIIAYDPMANEEFKEANGFPIQYSPNLSSLLSMVDHVVILTAWDEFTKNEESIKKKNVFDYRYIYH